MNKFLKKALQETPKFSELIANGFAREELKRSMEVLDKITRQVIKNSRLPLIYNGYRELKPTEEVMSLLPKPGSGAGKPKVDVSITDVKKYRLHLTFGSTEIYKDIYLPAIQSDGSIRVSGTKYYLIPTLTDPILSINIDGRSLYLKVFRDKTAINSKVYPILVDGKLEFPSIPYIPGFYKLNKLEDKYDPDLRNLEAPIALFLLPVFGLERTLELYGDCMYGRDWKILKKGEKVPDGWHTIATQNKQHTDTTLITVERHHLTIAMKDISNSFSRNLAFAMMYMFDAFPKRALEVIKGIGKKNEVDYWKLIVGECLFKGAYTQARIYEAITEHLNKIEGYIDLIIIERFEQQGIYINSIFDLMADLTRNFSNYILIGQHMPNNVKNKHIEVLYYTLFGIISNINKNIDELGKQHRHNPVSEKNLQFVLRKAFSPKAIYSIAKSGDSILPITLYSSVNDNKFSKIFQMMELQESGNGVRKGQASANSKFPVSVRKLVAVDLLFGTIHKLQKHRPTPRVSLNPFCQWDPVTYKPIIPKKFEKLLDDLDKKLSNTRENFKDMEIEVEVDDV